MDSCVLKLLQFRQKKMLKLCFFTSIIIGVILTITNADETKEEVWGPGLFPDKIVMPARYFFVKLNDLENRLKSKEFLKVVIDGTNKQKKPCRIWTDILDRKDNFFIVRYKIYEMCTYIKINVVYKNEHLPGSPFITNGRVYPDDCMCPMKSADELLNIWDCGKTPSLLRNQLNEFGKIDWDKQRGKVIKTFDKPLAMSLCHYVIKNNDIYRKCYGKYVDFKMFVDKTLLSLARKVKLPDVEFFANLGDWPLSTSDLPEKYPILSWCGSTTSYDITMPTYEITESVLENMGRVTVNTLSVQGNVEGPWKTRIPKLFWRGRDSNKYRLELILLAKKYPDLFNVSLTNFFFYRDEEHIYGPKSDYISFYKFFDYKYQLAIDGTVAPYRMPYLLAGGSLIFKPHSKYFEHFYNELEPNVHYIPVGTDVNDLIEKIKWARDNDEEAAKIAANGQKFSNEKISSKDIFCYHVHIFNEFSKKIVSRVGVLDGMEKVDQEKLQNCDCSTYFKDEL